MENKYIKALRKSQRSISKRLWAAVALLLISSILISSVSYAWLVLSRAPEVSGVTSTIGSNGNLEIALATTEHLEELQGNPKSRYWVQCFFDDDPGKVGSRVMGLPVYMEDEKVYDKLNHAAIIEIFIAINGLTDGIFPIDSAKQQADIARDVYYAAVGAEKNVRHITGPEGHRFYAALGWPAFDELTGWKEN